MIVDYITASHEMKEVTGIIDNNVFDLDDIGLLIIDTLCDETHAQVRYEKLDETEREEWFKENTPCCGDRTHIGWACDDKGCYPF